MDPTGHFAWVVGGVIAGVVIGAAVKAVAYVLVHGEDSTLDGVLSALGTGAATGGAIGLAITTGTGAVVAISAVYGVAEGMATRALDDDPTTSAWEGAWTMFDDATGPNILTGAGVGAVDDLIIKGIAKNGSIALATVKDAFTGNMKWVTIGGILTLVSATGTNSADDDSQGKKNTGVIAED